ncbi:BLUF domain-containing protein [Aquimarina sp. AD1]|uniref:BLUF domain-containing protein n=1 Tax=Aquimarina sp. (strain AD1) TaxID=1714848 RepID=UPI000E534316|nr:BLUF domain-containing protein [Aquimarina sp. AD1]AXT58236.1 BLUF domain-containing protein [Aquimarina sp. AD1]RKN16964.1 BLUF domain-containing protein [Aquimarina sp. AD1]
MWQTISYVSTASRFLTNSDVNELFEYVKVNNNSLKITGILMYSDGNFFQILEGEKKLIHDLFKKILLDSRHYDIIKIFDHEMTKPSFSKYNSNFSTINKRSEHSELQQFLEKEKSNNPETFKSISYLTNKFMQLS